jgi:hypothetical protein
MSAQNLASEPGSIVLRHHAAYLEVIEAPDRAWITLSMLAHIRGIRGGRIVITDELVYDVVAWDEGAESLLIEKAKCKGPGMHLGPWEHVPGTDSVEQCGACGEMSGK